PERVVPLHRNAVQRPSGELEALRLELPDALAAAARITHESRSRERVQVLGDGLARDAAAFAEPRDRQRAVRAQPADDTEPGLVTERGEDRRSVRRVRDRCPTRG